MPPRALPPEPWTEAARSEDTVGGAVPTDERSAPAGPDERGSPRDRHRGPVMRADATGPVRSDRSARSGYGPGLGRWWSVAS